MASRNSTDGMLDAAVKSIRLQEWMSWRARRYGKPCLTAREYEAMVWEMHTVAPMTAPLDYRQIEQWRTEAVQASVAARMRVSQQRVSQILDRAADAMRYFADHGIEARWRLVKGNWVLDAPCEDSTITIQMSYLVRANSRAMMKLA